MVFQHRYIYTSVCASFLYILQVAYCLLFCISAQSVYLKIKTSDRVLLTILLQANIANKRPWPVMIIIPQAFESACAFESHTNICTHKCPSIGNEGTYASAMAPYRTLIFMYSSECSDHRYSGVWQVSNYNLSGSSLFQWV